ncbi:MAG: hypothetical protein ACI8T1_004942 [Verrucomicrobiales bacterium]|jgi:hypothetical protein
MGHCPSITVLTETGSRLAFDIPGQEKIWQEAHLGEILSMPFGDPTISIVTQL